MSGRSKRTRYQLVKTGKNKKKKLKKQKYKVPKAWTVFVLSIKTLRAYWRVMIGLVVVHVLLVFFLVQGPQIIDFDDVEAAINIEFSPKDRPPLLLSYLEEVVGSNSTPEITSGGSFQYYTLLQSIFLTIMSLAYIRVLRLIWRSKGVSVKDAFYNGMQPLVQFVIVSFILALQLLPLGLAASIFATIRNRGIFSTSLELYIALTVLALLSYWTIRTVIPTVFAFYRVCEKGMEPTKAINDAKQIVNGRRMILFRRMAYPPVIGFVVLISFVLIVSQIYSPLASITYWASGILALPLIHSYYYSLHRSLPWKK